MQAAALWHPPAKNAVRQGIACKLTSSPLATASHTAETLPPPHRNAGACPSATRSGIAASAPSPTLRCTLGPFVRPQPTGLQHRPALGKSSWTCCGSLFTGAGGILLSPIDRPSRTQAAAQELVLTALTRAGHHRAPTKVYWWSSVAALRSSAMSSCSGNGGLRKPASTARCATLSKRRIAVLAALALVSVAISA